MVSIIPFEGICFCSNQNTSTIQKKYHIILVYAYQKLDDPIYYYIWLGEYILHKTNYTLKDLVDADNLNFKYL